MRLTARTIRVLMALIIVSLAGLICLQMLLLKNAYDQKEETFRQAVGSALASVSAGLETGEVVARVFTVGDRDSATPRSHRFFSVQAEQKGDSISTHFTFGGDETGQTFPMKVVGDSLSYSVKHPQRVSIQVFDVLGREDTTIVDTFRAAGAYAVKLDPNKYSRGDYFYQYSTDSSSFVVRTMTGSPGGVFLQKPDDRHEKIVRHAVDQLFSRKLPIEKRVKREVLDSLVHISLKEAGIDLPCVYAVLGSRPDSLRFASQSGHEQDLRATPYRARLYPADFLAPRSDLVLYFPQKMSFLLRSMAPLISATLLFMAGIVFAFVYSMRTIFTQRRLAVSLTEFINNMTHEFKTPISTIALASEAIARPDVLPDSEKVTRYNSIIHDENSRMKHQVDKILQMAVLEEGDYELHIVAVDAHDVISNAVHNIALQVEQKGGSITSHLEAPSHIVDADPVHLANIIHNILDNANKYSPDAPRIDVSTRNVHGMLLVSICDHGIGMKEEDARRAFDRYFRASTGNQHDVKGFGLGLSYVKLMMEALKGEASLTSSVGKGTTVELSFPAK